VPAGSLASAAVTAAAATADRASPGLPMSPLRLLAPVNSCDGRYADSLDVRFTRLCDNACPFCIEASGIPDRGTDVPAMIAATLNAPHGTVLILGGEPLLMVDQVHEYVTAIRPHKHGIYVTTSLPRTLTRNIGTFLALARLVDGINVSLQHHDWRINNDLLRSRNPYNRIDFLQQMLGDDDVAGKTRVSINLVRGG
jgi:molybdenum cofactor biosynthesis enzyme MoaA